MSRRALHREMQACLTPSTGLVSSWAVTARNMHDQLKRQREALLAVREQLKEIKHYIENTEVYKDYQLGDARPLSILIADMEMPDLYYRLTKLQGEVHASLSKVR